MNNKIRITKSALMRLQDGHKKFILEKKAMNLSTDTIIYYNLCYRIFSEFVGENALCKDIDYDTIIEYILHLKEHTAISDTTQNTYLRGLRAILYNLMEKGYIEPFKIKMVKAEKKLKETYTDEELSRLLEKPDLKTESFASYRTWVIICYLLGTGNRLRTLCNVKIGDIDFENKEIKLKKVKNKKQYTIPLSRTLEKVLREYLGYRQGEASDYLFCNQYGEQLSDDGLISSVVRFNNSRGVTKTSIHLFRHTFAKKWILNNGDIFRLQQILGHSSLDIVKEYVNIYGRDLQNDFEVFNPLDNMNTNIKKEKIMMKRR